MTRYTIVFTTYSWDHFVERQYRRVLSQCKTGDVYILADETRGALPIDAAFPKLSITEDIVADLSVSRQFNKALFWHNLDYLYMAFFAAHPEYEYYIFMDYDAVIREDVDRLIARIVQARADLVAEPVADDMAKWKYTRQHAKLYPPDRIAGCILPVVVLSHAAVAHLSRRRRELSALAAIRRDFFWPFCEAFVATELAVAGFKSVNLSSFGDTSHFAWWPAIFEDQLCAMPGEGFLHPVLDYERFVGSLLQHTPHRQLWRVPARIFNETGRPPGRDMRARLVREVRRRLGLAVERRLATKPKGEHEIIWDEG